MKTIHIGAGILEMVTGQGLRVLTNGHGYGEGEMLRMVETNNEEPTGRVFFAHVTHDLGDGVLQIDLQPFMEDINSETGKPERIPMAGEFANEKYTMPPEASNGWALKAKGEKPLWIYRGVKWVEELSVAGVVFDGDGVVRLAEGQAAAPVVIMLKVQGQGGELEFRYALADAVKP